MAFLDAVGESINRAACLALGEAANQIELLQYVLEPLATSPNYNGAAALYAQRCGLPLPPGFSAQPGFVGGQCATSYRVFWSGEYRGGAPGSANDGYLPVSESTASGVLGAIRGIRYIPNAGGNGARVVIDANGVYEGRFGFTTTNSEPFFRNLRITSVVRDDGQPDNCGNPPATVPPYQPGGNTVNEIVNITNNEGDEINIPVVLAFGYANFNLDGTINIPVNATFTANPEFNGNFNFNFNTGETTPDVSNPNAPLPPGCSDPGGYSPDPSIPDPPDGIPDEPPFEPPTGEPPDREELLAACIVTVSSIDPNTTVIFQDDNPDIFAPNAGSVMFKIRVGESSGWTNDIPVKNARCFIPCPWEGGAIEVRGTPRYGSVFTITPVRYSRASAPSFPPS